MARTRRRSRVQTRTQTDGLVAHIPWQSGSQPSSHPSIHPANPYCTAKPSMHPANPCAASAASLLATRRERLRLTLVGSQRLSPRRTTPRCTGPYRNRRRLNKVGAGVWLACLLLFGVWGWEIEVLKGFIVCESILGAMNPTWVFDESICFGCSIHSAQFPQPNVQTVQYMASCCIHSCRGQCCRAKPHSKKARRTNPHRTVAQWNSLESQWP